MLRSRWTPSPCAQLSRPRTTTGPPPHPDGIGRRRTFPSTSWPLAEEGTAGMVPTFTLGPFDGVGAQLCPCNIATATPQAFTVASRPARRTGQRVPRTTMVRVRAAAQPRSVRFELVGFLRSVQPLVPHVRLSVLLAGPRPSDGAGPPRRCQGCLPPSPSSQGSGCPQLHRAAATARRRRPFITARSESASWRSASLTHRTTDRLRTSRSILSSAFSRSSRRT